MDLTLLEDSTSARAAAAPSVSDPLSGKISSLKLSVIYHTENMLQFKVILMSQLLVLNMDSFDSGFNMHEITKRLLMAWYGGTCL